MVAFLIRRTLRDDPRPDRRQLHHLSDLLQDPGRRPGDQRIAGQDGDAGEHRVHPAQARARPQRLRAVVGHDEGAAQRHARLVLRPDERGPADQGRACRRPSRSASAPRSSGSSSGSSSASISAVKAGQASDRAITALALIGISLPVAWLGLMLRYLSCGESRTGLSWFPDGGYVPLTQEPLAVVLPPAAAVVHARRPLHRLLRPGSALEHPRHDQRGLRADGEGERALVSPDPGQAHAARVAHPDRDPVRPRLRRRARRRGDHHRGRLQHPGGRLLRGPVDPDRRICRR